MNETISSLCKRMGVSRQLFYYRKRKNPTASIAELLDPPNNAESTYPIEGKGLKTLSWIAKTYKINKNTLKGRVTSYYTGDNFMDLLYPVGNAPNRRVKVLSEYKGNYKTLREWAAISPREYSSFTKILRTYDIDVAINAPLGGVSQYVRDRNKPKPTQVKKTRVSKKKTPDTSHLEWDNNLELKRQIASDLKAGYSPEEILIRRKRKAI